MSFDRPETVEEWAAYISALHGMKLRDEAIAANTLAFIEDLQDEGHAPKTILDVLVMFALQFVADGQMPPHGLPDEYLSYVDLLEEMGKEVP